MEDAWKRSKSLEGISINTNAPDQLSSQIGISASRALQALALVTGHYYSDASSGKQYVNTVGQPGECSAGSCSMNET